MKNNEIDRIYIIGMSASGKSTLARMIAGHIGFAHFDTDAAIADEAGKSVAEIFADKGEEYFRELEQQILAKFSETPAAVISTGGGIILAADNRQRLQNLQKTVVIYLKISPEALLKRVNALSDISSRPLLAESSNLYQTINRLYLERHSLYQSCADATLVCSANDSKMKILKKAINLLSQYGIN